MAIKQTCQGVRDLDARGRNGRVDTRTKHDLCPDEQSHKYVNDCSQCGWKKPYEYRQ